MSTNVSSSSSNTEVKRAKDDVTSLSSLSVDALSTVDMLRDF